MLRWHFSHEKFESNENSQSFEGGDDMRRAPSFLKHPEEFISRLYQGERYGSGTPLLWSNGSDPPMPARAALACASTLGDVDVGLAQRSTSSDELVQSLGRISENKRVMRRDATDRTPRV